MADIISFAASAGVIDEANGIIRGVSLITEGVALGHKVVIDSKTLEQVKAAAESYSGGLKVNLNHNSGAGDIVGYIDNFSIVGQKLIGDLNLLQSSPHRNYIMEIASKIPDTFGLSIAFSGPSEMSSDKKTMLQRCSEIYSVDIVSDPAANPAGFFSRKLNQLQTDKTGTDTNTLESGTPEIEIKLLKMNPELHKEIAAALSPLSSTHFAATMVSNLDSTLAGAAASADTEATAGAPNVFANSFSADSAANFAASCTASFCALMATAASGFLS